MTYWRPETHSLESNPQSFESNSLASLWDKHKSSNVEINGIQISHVASEWGYCYMKIPLRVEPNGPIKTISWSIRIESPAGFAFIGIASYPPKHGKDFHAFDDDTITYDKLRGRVIGQNLEHYQVSKENDVLTFNFNAKHRTFTLQIVSLHQNYMLITSTLTVKILEK